MRRRVVTAELIVQIDDDLGQPLPVGSGNVLCLRGACRHATRTIRRLALAVDGQRFPIANHGGLRAASPQDDPERRTSGFWVTVPLAPIADERRLPLVLHAELDDGSACEATAGVLHIVPGRSPALVGPAPSPGTSAARVAICLATCDPDPEFLRAQIESLIRQTHTNWVCIVSDDCSTPERFADVVALTAQDPRFTVTRNEMRVGYYRNFERALMQVPADAEFVALSDHDDVWYPEKLATTLAAFRADTPLVYTDMDLVTSEGRRIASTYWTTRRNNYTDLAALLFANTVTGAATVFRASLLNTVLPFPTRIGEAYHDHWIACAALSVGTIEYVDASTYAYRQHSANVLGHWAPRAHRLIPHPRDVWRTVWRSGVGGILAELWQLREIYDCDVVRLVVIARVLLLRCGGRTTAAKRAVLARVADLERARFGLVREAIVAGLARRPTLGAERYCLKGAFAAWLLDHYYRASAAIVSGDETTRQ